MKTVCLSWPYRVFVDPKLLLLACEAKVAWLFQCTPPDHLMGVWAIEFRRFLDFLSNATSRKHTETRTCVQLPCQMVSEV